MSLFLSSELFVYILRELQDKPFPWRLTFKEIWQTIDPLCKLVFANSVLAAYWRFLRNGDYIAQCATLLHIQLTEAVANQAHLVMMYMDFIEKKIVHSKAPKYLTISIQPGKI